MTFDLTKYHDELLFIPLGGSSEIGMNLNLYHYQGKWLIVDCGIGFANDYLPGVDILVPDISFLEQHKDNILAIILTHAHEDHLGALPYLWEELPYPVYATPFTAAVLKNKLQSEKMKAPAPINEVRPNSTIRLNPFRLEMIELTHSIPEMQALAIISDKGTILHTGDWKLDPNPLIGDVTNETRLHQYGDGGVLAIVCDSTNVFVEGNSGSEGDVRDELSATIRQCKQRVLVTTFSSNLARLESIIKAASAAGRVVGIAGRSIDKMLQAAQDSGYLHDVPELLTDKESMALPPAQSLIICTGSQGEPRAALTKIARGEHPVIKLSAGDTVVFSSREIPGNESRIGYTQNLLVEQGIEVISASKYDIHVSGHPARDELARMYQMVRPQIAIPVHGEPRHIYEHAKLARNMQVPEAVEASNGAVILLKANTAKQIGEVESGYIAIDGKTLLDTKSDVFAKRRRLRDEGIIFVNLVLEDGILLDKPSIVAPGCLDNNDDAELITELIETVEEAVESSADKNLEQKIRQQIRKIIKRELGKKPLLEVIITNI